ncbi:MAG: phosphoserine transaminase [Clostridiales bacterium GWF2_38_85]|nr:MAG: phosphoserine transaminase [Clostridiales bacterium GWF2_38_85]HBL83568.1 3-phosphoserine/phosphohydroxythreonine aminotransferase [Clostridiales bacterium]
MSRVYNFSAGPSMLPLSVLEKAKNEITDQAGSGMSVMEMSHRSKPFEAIIGAAEANFRKLMNIPDNYKVLFLQGGATQQFSAVPLNLMKTGKADYVISGQFSKKAADEAKKFGEVKIIGSSADKNFTYVPKITKADISPDADYVHICFNNTIFGTKYNYIPDTGNIPLIADLSSCILSTPIDVTKFGLIYAGAQKNMGPAGLTVVIVREDLIGFARKDTPVMLDYKVQAENDSMYNTPPCFSIYIAGLVFEWLLELGGLEEMEKINLRKANMLYEYLDNSKLFKPTAEKEFRSIMNVCFVTGNEELDKKFCSEVSKAGFVNLKGHRSVGGMRASIYNAMPTEGIEKLIVFMKEFERNNTQCTILN